ncbi:MAG: sigma 54-interacting transcriptional regulator [Firmicutes bacterium]|nr:sigma 54-interacting transcriptional regulator [Bacillota bacterium]
MPQLSTMIKEKPATVEVGKTLADLLSLWQHQKIGLMGVMDATGKLVGIIGKDLPLSPLVKISLDTPIEALMHTDFIVSRPETRLEDVFFEPGPAVAVVDGAGKLQALFTKPELSVALYQHTKSKAQELEAFLNAAISGIIAINKDGVVTLLNQAGEEITGHSRENAIGKHVSEVLIPPGLLQVLNSGEAQFARREVIETPEGTQIYIANRSPIIEDDEVVGAIAIFQDVTNSEFIAQELRLVKETNKELQALIDSSYDPILIMDPQGVILRFNEAYIRVTGFDRSDIIGRTYQDLHPKTNIHSSTFVEEILQKRQPVTQLNVSPLGNSVLITGNPVEDGNGNITQIVINARDLSEIELLRHDLEESKRLTQRFQDELESIMLPRELNLYTNSPEMQHTIDLCTRVARVNSTVLLQGESGVGKEVLAKLIHSLSHNATGPYVKINCGAIPEQLLESELFGYEKGAFSGASREGKPGLFEMANHGTILLDEVGDLPYSLQVKLLRVLQDMEITRLGGTAPKKVDVRVIAASNQNLEQMVREGRFREDLYFRLNVVTVSIPPLRDRKGDIIPLLSGFKETFCKKYNLDKKFDPKVIKLFLTYDWPGNVRELENMVEGLIVTSPDPLITVESLPPSFLKKANLSPAEMYEQDLIPLKEAVEMVEQKLISRAMEMYGSTYKAAEVLGVNQSTLVRKLARYRKAGGSS